MKYKDYYKTLGLERTASLADIKTAYRKLAHQYHPDVSKDPKGEEKFKEIAQAYATLKNPEKRTEYDSLGQAREGENFTPPPEWQRQYGSSAAAFDDVDLADFLNLFRGQAGAHPASGHAHQRGHGHVPPPEHEQRSFAQPGDDYSTSVGVTLETICSGGETDITLELPEMDEHGLPHRVVRTFRINIPKGAAEGQRLRLAGKGGPGRYGGKPGNLYVVLTIVPHPRYRLSGRDLYLDLPLTPAEAALGAAVEIETLGGTVELKIKPCTSSGQRLRLSGRGLAAATTGGDTGSKGGSKDGDLYAVVQIVLPKALSEAEQALYQQLGELSKSTPRKNFTGEAK